MQTFLTRGGKQVLSQILFGGSSPIIGLTPRIYALSNIASGTVTPTLASNIGYSTVAMVSTGFDGMMMNENEVSLLCTGDTTIESFAIMFPPNYYIAVVVPSAPITLQAYDSLVFAPETIIFYFP